MTKTKQDQFKPGEYGKKRMNAADWVEANIMQWRSRQETTEPETRDQGIFPCICFSRQIGVGALKIADLLSETLPFRVIDREILEYIAKEKNLSEKAVAFFDERYPGMMSELFSMLISEKTFLKSDYARQLAKTVTALAGTESTIFVGRGTHLILPKERILSVRLIGGRSYRTARVSRLLNIPLNQAEKELKRMDKEQAQYFKTVYNQTGADPKEFDLVINRELLTEASQAVAVIKEAFRHKFDFGTA